MSFNFPPMTEEELQEMNLIPEGIYNFEVIKATQKLSKSGNQMIELQLKVWDKEGRTHIVFDYLVNITSMIYKIKHFCDTTGLQKEYLEGNFDVEACEGLCGKAYIVIQKGQANPAGGMYADKNSVKDYVADEAKAQNSSNNDLNDDLPF